MSGWLHADGLSARIGTRTLLQALQLQVAPGETLAVLGENGAGKSTLLRLLAGERPAPPLQVQGEVRLDGRVLHRWPALERARRRAVLPQRPEVAFAFSAFEVAQLGRHAAVQRGSAREEQDIAAQALLLTDAWHLAAREVNTLSGGEQARVHLAAAFAQLWEEQADGPRYLLLDEPTAALDLAHQHGLLLAARAFAARRGIGIVTVLHDLNLAAMYADRVLLLHQGRVLGLGAPASVLSEATIAAGFGVRAQVLSHPLADAPLVATAAAA